MTSEPFTYYLNRHEVALLREIVEEAYQRRLPYLTTASSYSSLRNLLGLVTVWFSMDKDLIEVEARAFVRETKGAGVDTSDLSHS